MKRDTTKAQQTDKSKTKKVMFMIFTPGQAYMIMHMAKELQTEGYQVKILARDYRSSVFILESFDLTCSSFKPIQNKYLRIFEIFVHVINGLKVARKFKPSIFFGCGFGMGIVARLVRKPVINFTDAEPIGIQGSLDRLFTNVIITPSCYLKELGKKQVRVNSYKELAYLHPDRFTPDPQVLSEIGVRENEKYVILRFGNFKAVHDFGRRGFSTSDYTRLVQELEAYARVYIAPEGNLPAELEKYRLNIRFNRIHHAMYYAQLLVCDTGTMAWEAAVLGTPAVVCGSFTLGFGNFISLSHYGLLFTFLESNGAISKAVELIQQCDLKKVHETNKQIMLSEKIDFTKYMVETIQDWVG